MTHGAPGSLVDVKRLAPVLMASTGLVTIAESFLFKGGDSLLFGLAMFAIPTAGTTLLGKFIAERRGGAALAAAVGMLLAHVLLGFVITGGIRDASLVMMCALVVDGVTLALAVPALIACGVLGKRRDLDAGDTLLGVGGAWFATVQLGKVLVAHESPYFLVFLPGLALGLVAIAIAITRAISRRAWCRDVERGGVSGWRVRTDFRAEEAFGLAPLYGGHRATELLERYEEQPGPYRGVVLARPVATVPAR